MKKTIALIIALTMLFSLCACGGLNASAPAANADSAKPAAAASSQPAAAASSQPAAAESSQPAAEASSAESAAPEAEVPASDDPEVNLSLAIYVNAGNAHEPLLQYICNEAYKRSGGTIKIAYYPGGTLCGQPDMLDGIKNGVTDIGMFSVADNASAFPELSMVEKPGIYFASGPSISEAVTEYIETYQPAEMEGLHFLMAGYGTKGCICSNKGPIHTPDDLANQTIRATGPNAEVISALGAVPNDLAFADCYEGLRQGVVDGIMTIRNGVLNGMLYEVLDYGIDYPFYVNGFLYCMNQAAWDKLTPNQQEALSSAFRDAYDIGYKNFMNDLYLEVIATHFQTDFKEYYYPTEDEKMLFNDRISGIVNGYAATIDNGDEILQRWKDLAEKWNAEYPSKNEDDPDYYVTINPNTGERFQYVESDFPFTLDY